MTNEQLVDLINKNHAEVMTHLHGISIQITILFARIGAVEDRMDALEHKMDSLEVSMRGWMRPQ